VLFPATLAAHETGIGRTRNDARGTASTVAEHHAVEIGALPLSVVRVTGMTLDEQAAECLERVAAMASVDAQPLSSHARAAKAAIADAVRKRAFHQRWRAARVADAQLEHVQTLVADVFGGRSREASWLLDAERLRIASFSIATAGSDEDE